MYKSFGCGNLFSGCSKICFFFIRVWSLDLMLDDSMYSVDVVDKLYGLVKVGIMMIIIMVEIYLFFEI